MGCLFYFSGSRLADAPESIRKSKGLPFTRRLHLTVPFTEFTQSNVDWASESDASCTVRTLRSADFFPLGEVISATKLGTTFAICRTFALDKLMVSTTEFAVLLSRLEYLLCSVSDETLIDNFVNYFCNSSVRMVYVLQL